MKYQLVGYNNYQIKDKNTGEPVDCCALHLVRKPTLRETGAVGMISVCPVAYDKQIDSLPELAVNSTYECDINTFKGKHYLNSIEKL